VRRFVRYSYLRPAEIGETVEDNHEPLAMPNAAASASTAPPLDPAAGRYTTSPRLAMQAST
jgi:hypothetical protein